MSGLFRFSLVIAILLIVSQGVRLGGGVARAVPGVASRPPASRAESGLPISLIGGHRFRAADSPEFARSDYDDADWDTIHVPGGARKQGFRMPGLVGWYRLRFGLPDWAESIELGVDLGTIVRADETYLNGVRIGGEGLIAGRNGLPTAFPPPVRRVYRLPPELLRYGRENVLAIRVSGLFDDQAILGDSPRIDRFEELRRGGWREERWSWAVESFLLGVDVMTLLFCLFLYSVGIRDSELKWFTVSVLAYALAGGFEERIPHALGLHSPTTQTIAFLSGSCGVAALVQFFADAMRIHVGPVVRWLQALTVAFGVASCILFWGPSALWHRGAQNAWLLCWGASAIALLVLTGRGLAKREPESGPLAAGLLLVLAGTWHATLAPSSRTAMLLGVREFEFVVRGFFVCCAFGVVQRYARARAELRRANRRLLAAQEEERRRLSRDIHDGLGQSLNALKLKIDVLRSEPAVSPEALSALSEEARAVIDEARQISRDLRPTMLEQMGLVETLRWYVDRLNSRTPMVITISSDGPLNLPSDVQDHLYRVCQEALRNAVQHAGAGELQIRFLRRGRQLIVEFEDDGDGFDVSAAESSESGLGLRSIRERCELLRGSMVLRSRPGSGTRLRLQVPLPENSR